MSDKLAVLMEFNGYTKDELEAYLSLKFGSMTKGGMTASILSQSGYEKAKSVIFGQPQLNENQQIVLDYLKDKCNLYSFIAYKPFEAIIRLSMLDPEKNELRVKNTIDELTYVQQAQVLEVFSRWVQEQEDPQ